MSVTVNTTTNTVTVQTTGIQTSVAVTSPISLTGSATQPTIGLTGATAAEVATLSGVTSAIQTQIDAKVDKTNVQVWANNLSTGVDVFDRRWLAGSVPPFVSGTIYYSMFTPMATKTVSWVSMASVTACSGLTLARIGLFTYDETTFTLVARIASDTSLFASNNTVYTRSFDTTGGFPATYQLVAGTRYALGVIVVGSGMGTTPSNSSSTGPSHMYGISPKMSLAQASQSDLLTSTAPSFVVGASIWGRFS